MNVPFRTLCVVIAFALSAASAAFATQPYLEEFATNNASWSLDSSNAVPNTWIPQGPPYGSSHISQDFNAFGLAPTDQILFQGRNTPNNSSSDQFVGNWLGDGINQFSTWVRHDGLSPVRYFARFAAFGPGVVALSPSLIAPNTWTRLSFEISTDNIFHPVNNPTGQLIVEAAPGQELTLFNSTFTNMNNVQIGIQTTATMGLIDDSVSYRLDRPAINAVPEPTSIVFASMAGIFGFLGFRRRAASN